MKQRLKYGLLLLITLLIHSVNSQMMGNNCEGLFLSNSQKECSVSQDYPIQNALERLYRLYATQTCDLGHTDIIQVPTGKGIQLLSVQIRGHKTFRSALYANSYHIPKYLSDPITYYIYGLRKIII